MKISEVSIEDVVRYLRIEPEDGEKTLLNAIIAAAKQYISSYTGLPLTAPDVPSADDYEDITIAFFALCQDMYDNRTTVVENASVNRTVETILNLHRRNFV